MTDLTINTATPAATAINRNTTSSVAVVSAPANQVSNVIKAGEYSQVKGTIDSDSMYVVQFRDGDSGEVRMQYPSKKAASAYQKTASVVDSKSEAPAPAPAIDQAPAPEASGAKAASIDSGTSQDS
jgi:hypothetical protein